MLGSGTKQDPYLVSTEQDLNDIRNDVFAYYKLTNDIYLTEEWTPIPSFSGSIDGDGYTIFDLYINLPSESGVGFISYLDYGGLTLSPYKDAIKNLNFENANIVGGESTGIIAGRVRGEEYKFVDYFGNNYSSVQPVEIVNCKVTGTVRSSSNGVGGLVGSTHSNVRPTRWDNNPMINLNISDCHVNVDIYAFGSNIGGMVGDAREGGIEIYRSSTRGNIYNANQRVGGFVGYGGGGRTSGSNCYSLMNIQGTNYIGGMVGSTDYPHEYWVGGGIGGYFAGTFNVNDDSNIFIGVNVAFKEGIVNGGEPKSNFLYDRDKAQLSKFRRANIKDGDGRTTAEMMNIKTYIERGFSFPDIWYANRDTEGDYLRLKSEFDSDLFVLDGEGTEENPYLIKTVDHLVAVRDYDSRNWSEYIEQLSNENTFDHPNFKDGFNNFSPPRRYHYKLANDIDLNVHPWNTIGWKPINNTLEQSNDMFAQYNSIGEWIGVTSDYGRTFTDRRYVNMKRNIKRRGFMGVFDGGDHKIKNLKLTETFVKNDYESDSVSFFGVITNGTVKNIKFEGVIIESDSYRGLNPDYNRPVARENMIYFATVADVVQAPATIDRVMVEGESTIYDYREDVGGTRARIAGFIYNGTYTKIYDIEYGHGIEPYDDGTGATITFRGTNQKIKITNSSVKMKHTVKNVDLNDAYYHFTPFIAGVNYMHIENCYSASSNHAEDRFGNEIFGIHNNRVIIGGIGTNRWTRYLPPDHPENDNVPGTVIGKPPKYEYTYEPNSTLINIYYDSEIVNATPSQTERNTAGIHGRSTEAMYLVSTYNGWDFKRIWQSDGVSYPTLQPYDPNYTPPTNNTTHIVSSYVEGLYMMADSFGEHKKLRTVVLNSKAKRFTGKTSTTKRGTNHVNTVILPLYTVAFEYVEPVIGERTVVTEIIELNTHASAVKSSKKENVVTTALDGIETSVEVNGINRGAFFNAIEVVTIRTNSVSVKLNDRRISGVNMVYGENQVVPFSRQQDSNYIIIPFEPSLFNEGDNLVELRGIDASGNILTTKTLNVTKSIPTFKTYQGNYLVIDNEYYQIVSHTADGTITLNKELPINLLRKLPDGQFNTIEMIDYTHSTKVSIGQKGHTPNFQEGKLVKIKRLGNKIEEEYEFVGEGEEIITEISFARPENIFVNRSMNKDSNTNIYLGLLDESDDDSYVTMEENGNLVIKDKKFEALDNLQSDWVNGSNLTSQYMMIKIDIENFIKDHIDASYEFSLDKAIDINIVLYGSGYIKYAGSGSNDILLPVLVWRNNRRWNTISNKTDEQLIDYPTPTWKTSINLSNDDIYEDKIYKYEDGVYRYQYSNYFIILGIKMPKINRTLTGQPEETRIRLNYMETSVKTESQINTEATLINEIRQEFIPKNRGNTTI